MEAVANVGSSVRFANQSYTPEGDAVRAPNRETLAKRRRRSLGCFARPLCRIAIKTICSLSMQTSLQATSFADRPVAFLSDDEVVVTRTVNPLQVELLTRSLKGGRVVAHLGVMRSVESIATFPSGRLVLAAGNGRYKLFHSTNGIINKGTCASGKHNHRSVATAFSSSGEFFAVGDTSGTISVHESSSGNTISRITTGSEAIYSLALCDDLETLAFADASGLKITKYKWTNGPMHLVDVATDASTIVNVVSCSLLRGFVYCKEDPIDVSMEMALFKLCLDTKLHVTSNDLMADRVLQVRRGNLGKLLAVVARKRGGGASTISTVEYRFAAEEIVALDRHKDAINMGVRLGFVFSPSGNQAVRVTAGGALFVWDVGNNSVVNLGAVDKEWWTTVAFALFAALVVLIGLWHLRENRKMFKITN